MGASARIQLEKGKILRRAKRPADALDCFCKALELGKKPDEFSNKDQGDSLFSAQESAWIKRNIECLQDAIALGDAAKSDNSATDSGDGSGRWKVVKITGT